MSDNLRGAAMMAASMAAFTINDACMKALSGELPLFQALFLRGLATSLLMLVPVAMIGGTRLRLPWRDLKLVLWRCATEIGAAYCFVSAVFHMPLANATAIVQALPLTVTLAGALFLGEAVGWRRLSAILVGFAGVLLIVQPGAEGFTVYALYPLGAVALVTARDLLSRQLSREVSSMTVSVFNALAVMLFFGGASLFVEWRPVSATSALLLGGAASLIVAGYIFGVAAMRVGDLAVVSPFRYASLLCALVLGVTVFGERPNWVMLLGAAIVVATGIYTIYRERPRAAPAISTVNARLPRKPPGC